MIANSREFEITSRELRRFEEALAEMDAKPAEGDALIREALRAGIASEAQHLRDELSDYKVMQSGRTRQFSYTSLGELLEILAAARSAANLTEAELAERLDLSEQQVQRYEVERFRGASHELLQDFIDALDVRINGTVTMPAAGKRPAAYENGELIGEPKRRQRLSRTRS